MTEAPTYPQFYVSGGNYLCRSSATKVTIFYYLIMETIDGQRSHDLRTSVMHLEEEKIDAMLSSEKYKPCPELDYMQIRSKFLKFFGFK